MLAYIVLVVGFVLLVKGADFFVEGSAAVAKRFQVPVFIIGMTIVAMGTSAPECAVSIAASVRGSNGMAISNVIGSNIFNLLVVCGICALFSPLTIKKETLKKEFPFAILMAAVLGVLGFIGMILGHLDGIILLIVFVFFLLWMVQSAKRAMRGGEQPEAEEIQDLPMWKCLIFIGGGLIAIVLGGQAVVNSAETIALRFGLSETLVGLTVCSIGTSLP
jgi:cation:H+ antiporter